jgi:hypothetical protein
MPSEQIVDEHGNVIVTEGGVEIVTEPGAGAASTVAGLFTLSLDLGF